MRLSSRKRSSLALKPGRARPLVLRVIGRDGSRDGGIMVAIDMLDFALAPRVFVSLETFDRLAAENDLLRLERAADGRLIVLPPTGSEGGKKNAGLTAQLYNWNRVAKTGVVFDSNAGFTLPTGSVRSPDASWISQNRWHALTDAQKRKFAPICPDFAVELLSPSDSVAEIRAKCEEYIENGAALVWLIDPAQRAATIYRPGAEPIEIYSAQSLDASPELPGFVLDLSELYEL